MKPHAHPPWPRLLMARELGSGGSERQMAATARALDPSLFQAHVGCFRAGGPRHAELESAGIPVVEFAVRSFAKPSAARGAYQLTRFLRSHRIRLVHTFDVPTNIFVPPVARALNTCIILGSARAHRDLVPPLHRRLLHYTDKLVDGIVVNCEFLRRHLLEDYRLSPGLIHLCRNGIDTSAFR